MNKLLLPAVLAALAALFVGCSPSKEGSKNRLKVAATPVPHAELLEFVKPDLLAQGIDLVVITTDDYNMPNRALSEKDVDANFFQHIPFMDEQIEQFHYKIESLAKIELEPMGIYSKKVHSLDELPENGVVAVPNDPTNEARALLLLQKQGLIELDDPTDLTATVLEISSNPKNLKFLEVDAAMIPRALSDVDAAAINTNYALQIGLSPQKDALVLESADSPYANVIAIRTGDENRPDIQALKKAMTSEKMREHINQKYKGAVLPAFD